MDDYHCPDAAPLEGHDGLAEFYDRFTGQRLL